MKTDEESQPVQADPARGVRTMNHSKIAACVLAPGVAAVFVRVLLKPG
ncbi:MAG: hypothetical protein ACYSWW_12780 [Planctomycetota bacterium]|jgi:hypothetical protein